MPKRTRKSQSFDFIREAELALQWLIADRTEERTRLEAKGETSDRWYAQASYFTATDLEERIRAALAEKMEGEPYGTYGRGYGAHHGIRVSGGGYGENLFGQCRSFLLNHQDLESHNFGRGHVSGQRFRPRGWGLTDSEKRTLADKKKEKPVHARVDSGPACTRVKSEKQRKRRSLGGNRGRSDTHVTNDPEKITCKRCLKLLEEQVTLYQSTEGFRTYRDDPTEHLEVIETLPFKEVLTRTHWGAEEKLNGSYGYNSVTTFVVQAPLPPREPIDPNHARSL